MTAANAPSYVKTLPGRLVAKIPLPYWMSLLLLWEILFLVDYVYSLSIPGGHDHIAAFGMLSLFFAFVCISVEYCSRVLTLLYPDLELFVDHDHQALRTWYTNKLKLCYEGFLPILAGILFVLLEEFTIGDLIKSYTPDHGSLQGFRSAYRMAGFFFLGISLWALISVLLIPIQLMKFNVKVNLNQLSGRGLLALGSTYFKMSLAISICFVLIVITSILAGLVNNYAILFWEGIGALLIFSFFLLPQVGIHRIMSNEKEQRIFSFSHHLELALENALKNPTSDNLQRLKELFELQEHLKNMNEWPFNINTIWQLVTALLIPLGLALLEIIF